MATKDDIDNVVYQVKVVTEATEVAMGEITNRLSEQQWQSTQKRDVYVRLVDALERFEVKRATLQRSSDDSEKADARRTGLEALKDYRRKRVLIRVTVDT